jgi:pyruvate/2-oxoglutarate dehydrogenase complex dihydrolipoamide dehydrogenase (E3) component
MSELLTPDICIIGGGPGGIAAATKAAALAIPVVLVEKGAMGGANLAYGGVPSLALQAAADHHEMLRRGPAMGVSGAPLQVNFGKVAEHIRSAIDAVAPNVSAERLAALGVRIVAGEARFADRRTVVAGEATIRARRFIVATGALPAPPDLPGMESIDYLTLESAFDMSRKPTHLIVVGAGSRGLELAQAYARLGVDATVLDDGPALPDEDPELAAMVLDRLRAEGVRVRDRAKIAGIARRRGGIRVTLAGDDGEANVDCSHLLVATGRRPNIAGLGLDGAGVAYDGNGIVVDRQLRTTNRRVYAIGDAVAGPALANRAEYQGERLVRAIAYRLPLRDDPSAVPVVTFTDPGLARVGLVEEDARRRYDKIRVLRFPYGENDRAQAERMASGAVKVVARSSGRIVGAAVAGHDAGEQIALWSLALARGLSVEDLLEFVPPYPARADAVRRLAETSAGYGLTAPWRRRIIETLRKFG